MEGGFRAAEDLRGIGGAAAFHAEVAWVLDEGFEFAGVANDIAFFPIADGFGHGEVEGGWVFIFLRQQRCGEKGRRGGNS